MVAPRPKYIIDTCSFTALRRVYPSDVFPSVWSKMDDLANVGIIGSLDLVLNELKAQDDEVLDWAKSHLPIFVDLDNEIQLKATEILQQFATNFVDLKKRTSGADPFVVAAAVVHSCVVVTEEKRSGGTPRVKIPDVCRVLGVDCIHLLELLRREQFSL